MHEELCAAVFPREVTDQNRHRVSNLATSLREHSFTERSRHAFGYSFQAAEWRRALQLLSQAADQGLQVNLITLRSGLMLEQLGAPSPQFQAAVISTCHSETFPNFRQVSKLAKYSLERFINFSQVSKLLVNTAAS